MKLKVKYLRNDLPELVSKDGDSGYDIRAAIDESWIIPAKSIATIPAGICLELENYPQNDFCSAEIQIRPRSGLTKNGIIAQLGTVDASYRGEIKVNVMNFNDIDMEIKPLDRIAQIVICPIFKPEVIKCDELGETIRGAKGFGSSGKE